jgi:16S rRNA (cytosine1402-N4)-methyltransferase
VIGLDVDPLELPRAEAHLRAGGFGPDAFVARHANFAGLPKVLAAEGLTHANVILADLGVSSMQFDNPDRGFSYKGAGPLDMRMNPQRGESAAQRIARSSEASSSACFRKMPTNPTQRSLPGFLSNTLLTPPTRWSAWCAPVSRPLSPSVTKAEVKMSTRRTFQALRIAVNDEFGALDALLRALPHCLAPGGRVAILTFHSGEDRRVKKAFQAGHRTGVFSSIAAEVIRSAKEETFANRRASAAKLRWARLRT